MCPCLNSNASLIRLPSTIKPDGMLWVIYSTKKERFAKRIRSKFTNSFRTHFTRPQLIRSFNLRARVIHTRKRFMLRSPRHPFRKKRMHIFHVSWQQPCCCLVSTVNASTLPNWRWEQRKKTLDQAWKLVIWAERVNGLHDAIKSDIICIFCLIQVRERHCNLQDEEGRREKCHNLISFREFDLQGMR